MRPEPEVHLRLVVQEELLPGDRPRSSIGKIDAIANLPIHRIVEEAIGVAAVRLRPVQRHIGVRQQFLGSDAAFVHGDADADAGMDHVVAHQERQLHRFDEALGHDLCIGGIAQVGHQHGEFVATEAGDGVGRADILA